jgi:hemolysin activation/secretion protein
LWQLTNTYSYHQGVDWFGARDDGYISTETDLVNPVILEFKKINITSSLLHYFQNMNYSLNSNFHLQYTEDTLHDTNKETIGSSYTVRGYDAFNLLGNNAWYI